MQTISFEFLIILSIFEQFKATCTPSSDQSRVKQPFFFNRFRIILTIKKWKLKAIFKKYMQFIFQLVFFFYMRRFPWKCFWNMVLILTVCVCVCVSVFVCGCEGLKWVCEVEIGGLEAHGLWSIRRWYKYGKLKKNALKVTMFDGKKHSC